MIAASTTSAHLSVILILSKSRCPAPNIISRISAVITNTLSDIYFLLVNFFISMSKKIIIIPNFSFLIRFCIIMQFFVIFYTFYIV